MDIVFSLGQTGEGGGGAASVRAFGEPGQTSLPKPFLEPSAGRPWARVAGPSSRKYTKSKRSFSMDLAPQGEV